MVAVWRNLFHGCPLMWNVVLLRPEIPPNTGAVGRLCMVTGARLHLVGPLGFSLDDRLLKRAGLDYWERLNPSVWDDLESFLAEAPAAGRHWYLSTKGGRAPWQADLRPGDWFWFGSETRGLPGPLLRANADRVLRLPMRPGERSLNLAVAAGVVLYEAWRQAEA